MTFKTTLGNVVLAMTLLFISYVYYLLTKNPEIPKLEETWWGEGVNGKDDVSIRPFKIYVTKQVSTMFNPI